MLEPDRSELARLVNSLFKHCQAGWISLRMFPERGQTAGQPYILAAKASSLAYVVEVAEDIARRAANEPIVAKRTVKLIVAEQAV